MTSRRSRFRPCIDLHGGQVKQIVGGTLSDRDPASLRTNFVARRVHMGLTVVIALDMIYSVNLLETSHGFTGRTAWKEAISSNWVPGTTLQREKPSLRGQVCHRSRLRVGYDF
jgi:hypothetical protein